MVVMNTSKVVQNDTWFTSERLSLIGMGAGLVAVTGAFISQFFSIKNGSSGQTNIAAKTSNILWIIGLCILLLLLSGVVFLYTKSSSMPYVWLFAFAMFSFVISNIALLISTFQVSVEKI
jgi:hypothetical protein